MKRIFYVPLTAAPYKQNKTYIEIQPQSPQLAGIVRCFWGSNSPYLNTESVFSETMVIPDTCVDIIYQIDYTENIITGKFCGINDARWNDYFMSILELPQKSFVVLFVISICGMRL